MLGDACGAPSVRESVSSYADTMASASDLGLLRTIESTVDVLCDNARFFRGHTMLGRGVLANIRELEVIPGSYLDEDGELGGMMAKFAAMNETKLAELVVSKDTIRNDHRLRSHHCDQLNTAYDELLKALADAADVARDIAAALVTHDLTAEPRNGEAFANIEALHKALVG